MIASISIFRGRKVYWPEEGTISNSSRRKSRLVRAYSQFQNRGNHVRRTLKGPFAGQHFVHRHALVITCSADLRRA